MVAAADPAGYGRVVMGAKETPKAIVLKRKMLRPAQ